MGCSGVKSGKQTPVMEDGDLRVKKLFDKDYNFSISQTKATRESPLNLCFEGGGVKGIAYVGALKALDDYNHLNLLQAVIGTSAGSLAATMISLGCRPLELLDFLKSIDFCAMMDDSSGVFRDFNRLRTEYGLYKGNVMRQIFDRMFTERKLSKDLTFEEAFKLKGIELIITGTSLRRQKTVYFTRSNKDYKDMKISDAMRISMCIPFLFTAVEYQDDLFVDGGVVDNFPFRYWDDPEDPTKVNERTIGLLLSSPEEMHQDHMFKVTDFTSFTAQVFNTLSAKIEKTNLKYHKNCRVVEINTADISAVDFELIDEQIIYLLCAGYISTVEFLLKNKYIKEILNKEDVEQMRNYTEKYISKKGAYDKCNEEKKNQEKK